MSRIKGGDEASAKLLLLVEVIPQGRGGGCPTEKGVLKVSAASLPPRKDVLSRSRSHLELW